MALTYPTAVSRDAVGQCHRVHCAGTAPADAIDHESAVVEQPGEDPPCKCAMSPAALQCDLNASCFLNQQLSFTRHISKMPTEAKGIRLPP
jgi:hypothetical protein